MRRLLFLTLLLLSTPAPPSLTARWDNATHATITWTQTTRGCLYRESAIGEHVFITCVEQAGAVVLALGGPETDGAYRPTSHDVYILVTNGAAYRAPLIGRTIYLPAFQ